jgi:glutathione S-transferase
VLASAVEMLNKHLAVRTFIVGERISAADFALVAPMTWSFKNGVIYFSFCVCFFILFYFLP